MVTRPSKPSARRVRAAFPPAIPPPTITTLSVVNALGSDRFFVHQRRCGGHRFKASNRNRLARDLAHPIRARVDACESLFDLLELLSVELVGNNAVFAVVDPLRLVIIVTHPFLVADRVHDVALPRGDSCLDGASLFL